MGGKISEKKSETKTFTEESQTNTSARESEAKTSAKESKSKNSKKKSRGMIISNKPEDQLSKLESDSKDVLEMSKYKTSLKEPGNESKKIKLAMSIDEVQIKSKPQGMEPSEKNQEMVRKDDHYKKK